MKKKFLLLISALTAFTLNSCIQHETSITLNKDGSGTIVVETRLGAQALAMMSVAGNISIEDHDNIEEIEQEIDPIEKLMSKESTDKRAKELGEGVTFVKAEPVTIGTFKGARITYRFADINKVRIGSNEGMEMMNSELEAQDEKPNEKDKIGFSYKNGILTVKPNIDSVVEGTNSEITEKEVTDKDIGMMKMMMADMKFSFKMTFESGIVESNASHQENDTVTILEMDMNKIMEKPEGLKKFMSLGGMEEEEAMKQANTIDGMKAETKAEITIKLK